LLLSSFETKDIQCQCDREQYIISLYFSGIFDSPMIHPFVTWYICTSTITSYGTPLMDHRGCQIRYPYELQVFDKLFVSKNI